MERKLLRILCFVAGILINSFGDCIYHEGGSWDVSYIKFALCIESAFYSDSRTIYFYYEHRIYCGADCTFGERI